MKKIKFLNAFIIIMMAFQILNITTNIYLVEMSDFGETLKAMYEKVVFGQVTPYIQMILSILTFVGLIYVQRAIHNCIKEGYFNSRSISKFKYAAFFLLLTGSLSLSFDLISFWTAEGQPNFTNLGTDFFMLIIAFCLYIIADVIENGSLIRQDNELTI